MGKRKDGKRREAGRRNNQTGDDVMITIPLYLSFSDSCVVDAEHLGRLFLLELILVDSNDHDLACIDLCLLPSSGLLDLQLGHAWWNTNNTNTKQNRRSNKA